MGGEVYKCKLSGQGLHPAIGRRNELMNILVINEVQKEPTAIPIGLHLHFWMA